jgi:hypothetical protein
MQHPNIHYIALIAHSYCVTRLGRDRVGVFDGTKAKNAVKQFINS